MLWRTDAIMSAIDEMILGELDGWRTIQVMIDGA